MTFAELKIGDVFIPPIDCVPSGNHLYMKVKDFSDSTDASTTAVCLIDGSILHLKQEDIKVEKAESWNEFIEKYRIDFYYYIEKSLFSEIIL